MTNKLFQGDAMSVAIAPKQSTLAPIAADVVYPLEDFKLRTGLESASIRKMRRHGFVVRRIGRRSFVSGREFIAWAENAPQVGA
jgi:hypothetical protein